MPRDWHREKIKAEIRMRGTTMRALSYDLGLCPSAVTVALLRPWPKVEAAVAALLGRTPQDIWPSRYDQAGQPAPGRYAAGAKISAADLRETSQKRRAA